MADLVSVDWLSKNLEDENVKVLDCTWLMPGETTDGLPVGYIPGTQSFDIDEIADTSSEMKHMLPTGDVFSEAASTMNIQNSDHVICYDRHGVRAAPRVWWSFKVFGHEKVSVLDGGLPSWLKAGHGVDSNFIKPTKQSHFEIKDPLLKVTNAQTVLKAIDSEIQIVDARPTGRYFGTSPEPRDGLRSGRIPGSLSLPFGSLKKDDGSFLPLPKIAELVGAAGIDLNKPIITSCGSGVTAAGIAFTLHRLGAIDITLYDGSWTEWGASDLPVEI